MKSWSLPFRYLMGVLLLAACAGFLYYAHEALEPIIIAAFIAYLIHPAVTALTRKTSLKRSGAVNLVYFTTLAALIAIPATITPIFFNELAGVAQDLMELMQQTQALLSAPIMLAGMQFDLRQLGESLNQFESAFVAPVPEEAFLLLESTSRGAIWFLVIVVSVYLFMAGWTSLRDGMIRLAPAPHRAEVKELYRRVRGVWMAYLRGQLLLMLIVGVIFTIAWSVLGIPGALVLGVVAGLFTLVPDIGPLLAALLAMGVALLEGSNWIPLSNFWVMAIVLAVYLVLINIKNLWLRPLIMGRSVNMNEGLVFVAILTATVLNGILGALLVVPVLASAIIIVKFLIRHITGNIAPAAPMPPRRSAKARINSRKRNRN